MTKARMWLGLTYERQERYEDARDRLETAHSILVKELGPEHLETLASQHHLANFFYKRKKFLQALRHFNYLLEVEEKMSGPEKSEAIKTCCMVVLCLGRLHRLREAEPHLRRVVPLLNLDPTLKADELEDSRLLYLWLGRITMHGRDPRSANEAKSLLHEALTRLASQSTLKKELTECQISLAEILHLEGNFSQAEHTIRQTLSSVRAIGTHDSLKSQFRLAESLMHQNKLGEAQNILETSLPLKGIDIPDRHPRMDIKSWLDWLYLLGQIYLASKQLEKAPHCFQKVVEGTLMEPVPLAVDSLVQLGRVLLELQDFQLAAENLRSAWQLISLPDGHRSHRALENLQSASPMLARYYGTDHQVYLGCLYDLAYYHMRKGEFPAAKPKFEELLHSKCQDTFVCRVRDVLAPFWIGIIHLRNRKYKDAEEHVRKALEAWDAKASYRGIQRKELVHALADSLYWWGQKREGIEESRLLMKQLLEDELSETDEERRTIIYKGEAWFIKTRELLARCNHHTERFEEAYQLFQILIPAMEEHWGYDTPRCYLARAHKLDCLGELGRCEEIEALANQAASRSVDSGDWTLREVRSIGLFWLGRLAFDKKNFSGAQLNFQKLRTLWPSSYERFWDYRNSDCRYFLACIDQKQGKFKTAEASFTELAKQHETAGSLSRMADCRYMLADCLRSQESKQAANEGLRQVIDENLEGHFEKNLIPRSCEELAIHLYQEGKYQEAKPYFEQTVNSLYTSFKSIYYKGQVLYRLGMYNEAASWFSAAPDMKACDPRDVLNCLYWAGASYAAMKKWPEATIKLREAYLSSQDQKGWPNASFCRYLFAQALFAGGMYTEAKTHFEALLKTPSNSWGRGFDPDYYLGCCLLELGQHDAAEKALLNTSVLAVKLPGANTKTRKPNERLARMSARFQLLRCIEKQGSFDKLCRAEELYKLGEVFTFFENCRTAYEQSFDPSIALVEFQLARIAILFHLPAKAVVFFELALAKHEKDSQQQHDGHSTLPVLQCQSGLGVALCNLGRYEDALYPLCQVLEKLKVPPASSESSSPQQKFDHAAQVMKAKLDLCRAAYGAEFTSEAIQLARDVLDWTARKKQVSQQEAQEEEQDASSMAKTDEKQQLETPSQQESSSVSANTVACDHHAEIQRLALSAQVLLVQISYDLGKDYQQVISLCNAALTLASSIITLLAPCEFDKYEIQLLAYLALSLRKLPDRQEEAEQQAGKAMEIDKSRTLTVAETMEGVTEQLRYCRDIKGFKEEFGAMLDSVQK
ncbi:hypothetical protein F5Y16DRAFT_397066 [Xylariaceae sp. FL0255]|nr:hypothetical protein F5Y16DRAFT_397066 [Xylariaceae sp. FL0255]